ncbi:MAG TPA: DUF2156 domain-containing protein [Pseudonocardiaceae bacterium]|jgi:lysylphosphatidylglycerol synthetase-like protein (DUF2156 family)
MTNITTPLDFTLEAVRTNTYADNPSAFLAVNDGNSYFTEPGLDGVIVYRRTGAYLVQFGGPFAAVDSAVPLLRAFRAFAHNEGRRIVGIQLQRADAEIYLHNGFTVNQVGASYAVDLSRFSLQGTRFMRLRNKIARAHKAGLIVFEATVAEWGDAMRALDGVWLHSKGEHVRQLEYLVGQYGGEMQPHRRLFVGTIDGDLAGYISYSPVYGSRTGWMHDLSRRIPGKLPGIMEAVNKAAIDTFIAESVDWLHFGFTPFTGLDAASELPGYHHGFHQFMHLLWEYGEAVYPAQTQLAYKEKWAQHVVLPEYVAFDGPVDIAGFVHVFRAAGAL